MAFFVWEKSGGAMRAWPIDRSMLVVGGSRDADLAIPHASVAARQALLTREGETVRITALADGCAINGASLTRDMPSSLEEGDLVRFGNVTLTFQHKAPIQAAPPPRPPSAQPKSKATPNSSSATKVAEKPQLAKPAASSSKPPVWKFAALTLAFLVVILIAILAAVLLDEDDPVVKDERGWPRGYGSGPGKKMTAAELEKLRAEIDASHAIAISSSDMDDAPERGRAVEPTRKAPSVVRGTPPEGAASIAMCPDLIELDDGSFVVARVESMTPREVRAKGCDGRVFVMDAGRVSAVHDRADLERRVEKRRAAAASDTAELLRLARWCHERYAHGAAIGLVDAVLKQTPSQPEALALRRAWMGE